MNNGNPEGINPIPPSESKSKIPTPRFNSKAVISSEFWLKFPDIAAQEIKLLSNGRLVDPDSSEIIDLIKERASKYKEGPAGFIKSRCKDIGSDSSKRYDSMGLNGYDRVGGMADTLITYGNPEGTNLSPEQWEYADTWRKKRIEAGEVREFEEYDFLYAKAILDPARFQADLKKDPGIARMKQNYDEDLAVLSGDPPQIATETDTNLKNENRYMIALLGASRHAAFQRLSSQQEGFTVDENTWTALVQGIPKMEERYRADITRSAFNLRAHGNVNPRDSYARLFELAANLAIISSDNVTISQNGVRIEPAAA